MVEFLPSYPSEVNTQKMEPPFSQKFSKIFKNKKFNFADPASRGQARHGRGMEREDEALPAEI